MKGEINPISYRIIRILFDRKQMPYNEMMEDLNYSSSQMRYKMQEINSFLEENQYPPFQIKKGIIFSGLSKKQLLEILPMGMEKGKGVQKHISAEDRARFAILYFYCSPEPVSIVHLQIALKVSKNSILSDINCVKTMCEQYKVHLLNNRKKGYFLEGTSCNVRKLISYCVKNLRKHLDFLDGLAIMTGQKDLPECCKMVKQAIHQVLNKYDLSIHEEYCEQFICLFTLLLYHIKSVNYIPYEVTLDKTLMDYCYLKAVEEIVFAVPKANGLEDNEKSYLLAGLIYITQEDSAVKKMITGCKENAAEHAHLLINCCTMLAQIRYTDSARIFDVIYQHIRYALFQAIYGFTVINLFENAVRNYYYDLYCIIREIYIQQILPIFPDIPEEEFSLMTMYLLSYHNIREEKFGFRALLYCHYTDEASGIFRKRLYEIFPDVILEVVENRIELRERMMEKFPDVIFTTKSLEFELEENLPVFLITPYLLIRMPEEVMKNVYASLDHRNENVFLKKDQVNQFAQELERFCQVKDVSGLKRFLREYDIKKKYGVKLESEKYCIKDLISRKNLLVVEYIYEIKDAVWMAAVEGIATQCISKRYVEACFRNIENIFKYNMIFGNILVVQERERSEVNRPYISVLKFNTPMELPDKAINPIKVIIFMAMPDDGMQFRILGKLCAHLRESDNWKKLLEAKDIEELYHILSFEAGEA